MLYDQLDLSAPSRATRFGVDLKVVAAQHETSWSASEPSLYEKLRAVEQAIERSEPPGSIDNPEPYIRDRADLWSIVLPSRLDNPEGDRSSETVLFCGESRRNECPLVLGGSAAHLQPAVTPVAKSSLNSIFFYLQREIAGFLGQLEFTPEADTALSDEPSDEYGFTDTQAS